MRKLKIISIGYFNYRNAGDDLLRESIEYIFRDHQIMFTNWFPGVDVLNNSDLVVVGGGSIWPDFSIFTFAKDIAKQLKVPIIIIGISARRKDKRISEETKELIEKSVFFSVRDKETELILNPKKTNKLRLTPDLFWWTPIYRELSNKIYSEKNVCLNLRDYEIDNWNPKYVTDTLDKLNYKITPLPMFFGSSAHDAKAKMNDLEILESLGLKVIQQHFDINQINTCRFVISMRFHGILASVMLRRPVISFDYHPKIINFYHDNGIPELCASTNNENSLKRTINLLEKNFSTYVNKIEKIANQLEKQGAESLEECRYLTEKIATSQANTKSMAFKITKSILSRL